MKYIRIKNSGLIEAQALHLVGASTKRNDKTKIGQFGSGNKYALAYFLRSGYDVKIFSGSKEIKIETKKENFRDQDFHIIYIDGERTSITTEMGKDWKFWQAMREIYCNAIDEGGYSMDYVNRIEPVDTETHFYIDTKKDVVEFITNFDNYFGHNKKILFECEDGKILEKTGTKANVYRKGIKCINSDTNSIFDYDFTDIDIDENRLVKYSWEVEEKIWKLIYQCTNEELIKTILCNVDDKTHIESCVSDWTNVSSSKVSEAFKNVINNIKIAPESYAGLLKEDERHNHVIVPTKVFNALRGIIDDENVGKAFKLSRGNEMFREIEPNELQKATIKEALYFLSEVKFEMPYEVSVAIFDNKHVLGRAYQGKIILSEVGLERGVNDVVNTLIEEFIHIKYASADETRDFQTNLIFEFISYMKKHNSFLI